MRRLQYISRDSKKVSSHIKTESRRDKRSGLFFCFNYQNSTGKSHDDFVTYREVIRKSFFSDRKYRDNCSSSLNNLRKKFCVRCGIISIYPCTNHRNSISSACKSCFMRLAVTSKSSARYNRKYLCDIWNYLFYN